MTMDDLRRRFASLDAVAAPDLEAEIELRAAALAQRNTSRVLSGRTIRRPAVAAERAVWDPRFATVPVLLVVALLLVVLIAALALGAGWWLPSTVVVPTSSATPGPSASAPAETSPSASPAPRIGAVVYAFCDQPDAQLPPSCAGDWRMWVVNADGTGGHELRPGEPGSQDPITWSPDGSRLLYASDSRDGLAMTDAAGSTLEGLPSESFCPVDVQDCRPALSSAVFSPDGRRLAYAIFATAGGSGNQDGVIAILDIATGRVTTLESSRIPGPLRCCDGYYAPSWSADGGRLAFAMPVLTSFTINVDGSDLRQLMPSGEGGTAPLWSPDGSTIASTVCGTAPAIYLVQPDGGDLRIVARNACDPHWTRDGRIVFSPYSVSEGDQPRTWIVDADGGNVQRLDQSVPALTAAGCLVCQIRDGDRLINGPALWQPVAADQP
jgi:WD40 repeat protein